MAGMRGPLFPSGWVGREDIIDFRENGMMERLGNEIFEFYCLRMETIYIIPSNQMVSPQQVYIFGRFYEISIASCNTIYAVTH